MSDYNVKYTTRGLKFYRFPDPKTDEVIIIRLLKYDEVKKQYKMMNAKTKEIIIVPEKELFSKWVRLNPDGILEIVSCKAIDINGDEVPDVMVALHRMRDGIPEAMPYAICRQSVIDIFVLMLQNKYIAGMTITKDTCPPEVNFAGCYAYTKSTHMDLIAVYMDDYLDDMLECINVKKYNNTLKLIKSRDKMGIPGYCETLHDLLHTNYFMRDVRAAFNIAEFDFPEVNMSIDDVNRAVTDYIIRNKHEVPTAYYPVHYGKHFDLVDIKRHYILATSNSYLYPEAPIFLIGYDESDSISYIDMVNKGMSPKTALKETMAALGWK